MGVTDDLEDPVDEVQADVSEQPEPEAQTGETAQEEESPEVAEPEVEAETEPAAPEKDPIPYQKFSKVWGERQQYKKDAEYWREQAMANQPKPVTKTDPVEYSQPKPRYEDFDDVEDYYSSLTNWELDRREFKRNQESLSNSQAKRDNELFSRISAGVEKYPDIHEVAFVPGNLPATATIIEKLSRSDHAADIVYYFGKNKSEAARIASMSPTDAAMEIRTLEIEMAGKLSTPKKITKAPTPTSPIDGKGINMPKKEEDMTMDEWVKWYESKGS